MSNKKVLAAFNKQMNEELNAAYIYLAMSGWFKANNFDGMAKWMFHQYEEEMEHAGKFADFIIDRGGAPELDALPKPKSSYKNPLEAYKTAYEHECKVSGLIHKLVELSRSEKDYPSENFLQWFVEEQVEEEASTQEVVDKLTMIGDSTAALFMYDRVLGERG